MGDPAVKKLCVVCAQVYSGDLATCPNDGTALVVASEGREDGNVLGMVLGSYRLIREIGSGGVGTVWEAEHVRLGRKMAVKILDPEIATDEAVQRFFNEARAVNEIRHPNIIEIEDFISDGDRTYLLMELLEGRDLRKAIAEEGRLSSERVTKIGRQVADGLSAAAKFGIVHRDLKPDNIFLVEREGEPDSYKLLDFGIAKFTKEQGVTQQGMTMGTPEYMAPEQITLRGDVDTRTDVYSLGIVLYEALTGSPPFYGSSLTDVLRDQLSKPPAPPSERLGAPLSPALEATVMKCLEKSPENRYQDMRELKEALEAQERIPSAADLLADRPRERRRSRLWILLPALAMSAVAAALYYAEELGLPAEWVVELTEPGETAPAPEPRAAVSREIADAAPARIVTLSVISYPEGARIFLGEERAPAGFAPRDVEVPMSREELTLAAQFPDGTEVVETVVPRSGAPAVVFMKPGAGLADGGPGANRGDAGAERAERGERERRPARRRTRPAKKNGDEPGSKSAPSREGTIDPFQRGAR